MTDLTVSHGSVPGPAPRAVVYLRVSTKEQAERGGEVEGFSIPAQREACYRKAEALCAEVVMEFADRGESAKTAQRPELQRMLRYIRDERVDYVICHKIDRLARNRLDDSLINLEIQQAGSALVSCTENIDETPSGMLMHGIMSSIAEFYSRNLANEVIKGSIQKAKTGGTIGKAPTGYRNVRVWENGQERRAVDVDPERGPLMTWAFEEYATGNWSARRLLEAVTEKGLTSPGGPRTPSKPLSLGNFSRLLRNPYYMGVVRYRKVQYVGSHPPLVSAATWHKVQDVLSAANTAGDKHKQHYHYLKGTVYCGECRERLIISNAKGKRGIVYPYFICVGRQTKRTQCRQRAVLIDRVAALVEDYYGEIQLTYHEASHLRDELIATMSTDRQSAEHERSVQERRIHSLANQRQKLLDAYYRDAIPADLLKAEQGRIAAETSHAGQRLSALSVEFDLIEANLNVALEFGKHCQEAYLSASPIVRRQLNQALFEKLFVFQDRLEGDLNEPFDVLLGHPAGDDHLTESTADSIGPESSGTTKDPRRRDDVGGLRVNLLVGAEGLEPPTCGL
jgi:site-specific DNA recombinase